MIRYISVAMMASIVLSCTSCGLGGKVRLCGVVDEIESSSVEMTFDGAASELGSSRNMRLCLDAEGRFDTTFYLERPEYFRINRNTLYLSPGDELECYITEDAGEARFSGKGAAANEYLKERLFPKAGSYLKGGAGLRGNFEKTRASFLELARQRREELEKLEGVTPEFKSLEGARITADIINSYCSYPFYASKEFPGNIDSLFQALVPEVGPMVESINRKEFLDVAVVRDVLLNCLVPDHRGKKAIISGNVRFIPEVQELIELRRIIYKLSKDADAETLQEAKDCMDSLTLENYKNELEDVIRRIGNLFPGCEAIDIAMESSSGEKIRLSDLKGRYLYIDFWATWCGPCCAESPFFESLAGKFNPDEILFVPVSTDTKKEVWLNYLEKNHKILPQYRSTDAALQSLWNVRSIPRFVILDPDFKILNANAPRPSNPATEAYLQKLLQGQEK